MNFKILKKRWNFAKSGHTVAESHFALNANIGWRIQKLACSKHMIFCYETMQSYASLSWKDCTK